MFCESCRIEIPPAWVVVIAKNECPACGGEIMTQQTKELLDELRGAMEKMPNDPEGLAGWLLSNYRLQKVGAAKPTEFYRKKTNSVEVGDLKTAYNPKSVFLKRAGMIRELERRKNITMIASELNEEADEDESLSVDQETDEVAEYEHQSQGLAKKALHNNSLLISGEGDERPVSGEEINKILVEGKKDNVHSALQADRIKRLQVRQEVSSGEKVGVIRRT